MDLWKRLFGLDKLPRWMSKKVLTIGGILYGSLIIFVYQASKQMRRERQQMQALSDEIEELEEREKLQKILERNAAAKKLLEDFAQNPSLTTKDPVKKTQ
jgi:ribosome assembly protein YihI (activator of Der GTPase)